MATINLEITLELLKNDGRYGDDPIPEAIYAYTNNWEQEAYSICYNVSAVESLQTSPHVFNPFILWSKESGLSEDGKTLLAREGQDGTKNNLD